MSNTTDAESKPAARVYYGWVLLPIAFFCYGLTFSPAYETWGFFAPQERESLGLSGTEIGAVFGLFSFWYQAASPLTSLMIHRFGLRVTISLGALLTGAGMWLLSQATTKMDCYLAFALIGGTGIALCAVLSMQTLAVFWFKRYRARAMALIMAGNTGCGTLLAYLNAYLFNHGGWRVAWQVYALTAVAVALVVAIFFRNRPEDVGQHVDGAQPETEGLSSADAMRAAPSAPAHEYPTRTRDVILSWQFMLVMLGGIAYVTAWSTFAAHGRLHMESFMFGATVSAGVIAIKNLMSTAGRLLSAGADFIAPHKLLALSLMLEGIGMAGLGFSTTPDAAWYCALIFGLGYGTAVVCVALTIAYVCGPVLFVKAAGICRVAQGVVSAALPIMAGYIYDETGSYLIPFAGAGLLAIAGGIGVLFCRPLAAKRADVGEDTLARPLSHEALR